MKCDECPAAWAERDIMTACGVEHGEYGCYIQGMEYGGEGDSCELAKCEVERRLKELKLYAHGEIKRPEWLLTRFLHDLTSQMCSVECGLPGFPPLWQSKTDRLEDEYCIRVNPLYGSTDMHYEVQGARRDALEEVSKEIAFAKRNIKSENSEYLTGYLAALSGVEGVIAEVLENERKYIETSKV